MGYIADSLLTGERVLVVARPSWVPPLITATWTSLATLATLSTAEESDGAAALIFGPLAFIGFLRFCRWLIAALTTEMAATDRRVIAKQGLIRRTTLEIQLAKIESLQIRQGVFGRLFRYGAVVVRGTGGTAGTFYAIANPVGFKKRLAQLTDAREATTVNHRG